MDLIFLGIGIGWYRDFHGYGIGAKTYAGPAWIVSIVFRPACHKHFAHFYAEFASEFG